MNEANSPHPPPRSLSTPSLPEISCACPVYFSFAPCLFPPQYHPPLPTTFRYHGSHSSLTPRPHFLPNKTLQPARHYALHRCLGRRAPPTRRRYHQHRSPKRLGFNDEVIALTKALPALRRDWTKQLCAQLLSPWVGPKRPRRRRRHDEAAADGVLGRAPIMPPSALPMTQEWILFGSGLSLVHDAEKRESSLFFLDVLDLFMMRK